MAAEQLASVARPAHRHNRLLLLLLTTLLLAAIAGALHAARALRLELPRALLARSALWRRKGNMSSLTECQRCWLLCSNGTSLPRLGSSLDTRSAAGQLVNESVHRRDYEFSCMDTNPCIALERPLLAVLVFVSAPANSASRDAIRRTWASEASQRGMIVVFLVGVAADNRTNQAVGAEALRFGDVLVANVADSYDLLTLKSLVMLKWATTFCRQANYLTKVDDDLFVSLLHLEEILLRYANLKRAIIGNLLKASHPVTNRPGHKWANPYYLRHYGFTYPPYVRGAIYVTSMNVVPELFDASQSEPFDRMEDVFVTGICARKIGNVTHVGHRGFLQSKNSASAFLDKNVVAAHQLRPSDMLAYWSQLKLQPRLPTRNSSVVGASR